MTNKTLLITGLGVISAAGNNLSETLDSLSGGERNAGKVTLFNTTLQYPVFEAKRLPEKYYMEGMRTMSLALCAVDEALENARLGSDLSKYRLGVCMGTTVACQLSDLSFFKYYRDTGSAPMGPVDRYLKGNIAEFISRRFKTGGPVLSVVNACSSGNDAVGVARSWLNNGLCDIAVAGGADELNRVPLSGFGALGIVSHELCAPFDRDRKGLNLGEGAGVLVLETEESAVRRGMSSELCLLGYGSASDSYHLTTPRPDGAGLEASILKALADSGTKPEDISFINAHGTATHDNDAVEGKVLANIFGTELKMLSTKGFTGHTLGAAGGIEAVFSAAALREGWVPVSAGFKNRDEDIPAPLIEKTALNGDYALSTSLAFGGNNAALLFRRRHKK
jgi:3-oxoacyl-(acyl-carrier-protein) synthase